MVQKKSTPPPPAKKRGRPRAYDPDVALAQATAVFWDAGYAATSLDDLSAATGMNRPSLYAAFGDKRALYLRALECYRERSRRALEGALSGERALRDELAHVFSLSISLYLSGEHGPRGCMLIGTAATESVLDPEVRALLKRALRELEQVFELRFRRAREQGELGRDADPSALAQMASSTLDSLAVRARAGESRAALSSRARAALGLLCG